MSIVINLFGASGSGKSTGASYIFSLLKLKGLECEIAPEFIKEKVWEGRIDSFCGGNQIYIFGKQFYRISRLQNKVDFIITDSPVLLSNVYGDMNVLPPHFKDVVREVHKSWDSMNYFIEREKPFNPNGRNEKNPVESDAYIDKIKKELNVTNTLYTSVKGNEEGYNKIIEDILDYCERVKGGNSI